MLKFLEWAERMLAVVAGVATLALMVATAADAASRYLLNRPITGIVELTADYAMVMIVFLSLSYATRHGALMRIPLFVQRLSGPTERWVNYAVQLVSAAMAILLAVALFLQFKASFAMQTMSAGVINYLLWPSYAIALCGIAVLALRMVVDLAGVRSKSAGIFAETPEA